MCYGNMQDHDHLLYAIGRAFHQKDSLYSFDLFHYVWYVTINNRYTSAT